MTRPDPGLSNQAGLRSFLRIGGPILLGVGLLLTAIALADFFGSMGSFTPPRNFWMGFVGLPLIAVGSWMTQAGFLGAASRYVAGEVSPVIRDAIGAMRADEAIAGRICSDCGGESAADATFCDDCGKQLPTT